MIELKEIIIGQAVLNRESVCDIILIGKSSFNEYFIADGSYDFRKKGKFHLRQAVVQKII